MKTRLMAALLCLPADFALAHTGNPFRGGKANDADATLVKELSELADEAERTNSASAVVISQLRDLIRRYSRPNAFAAAVTLQITTRKEAASSPAWGVDRAHPDIS